MTLKFYQRKQPHPDPLTGEPAVWEEFTAVPGAPEYPGDGVAPGKVDDLVVTAAYVQQPDGSSEPGFILTWSARTEADVIGYEVQWQEEGGSWATPRSKRSGSDAPGVTVSDVTGSGVYEFRVRAYDMEAFNGPWSDVASEQALKDYSAPNIPDAPSVIGGYRLLGCNWNASAEPDFSFYQVRFRVEGSDDWAVLSTKTDRIVISDLDIETTYEVGVRAVDRSGNVRVSGSPDAGDEVIVQYDADEEAGYSETAVGTTTVVGSEDVAVHTLAAEFVWTGVLDASRVVAGDLKVGGFDAASVIRMYDSNGRPIAAQGEFGLVMVDPDTTGKAMWLTDGLLQFTSGFDYQGDPLEDGIDGTAWTLGIGPDGINAEAITFGSQFGGNNRVLNAGFELRDFDTATRETAVFEDASDWGSPTGNINMDVSGTELRMVSV